MAIVKMNPEIKAKWLDALRSGEYRQGQNVLKKSFSDNDKPQHCCLGVLCEIAIKEGLNISATAEILDGGYREWYFEGQHESLPLSVVDWAGLWQGIPVVPDPTREDYRDGSTPLTNLAQLNDDGYDFNALADLIEREL